MFKKITTVVSLALGLLLPPAAIAQQAVAPTPQSQVCLTPNLTQSNKLNWFLGFHPSDDLLTTWCRIQTLPGNVRFNVQWPVTGVHKSWDTSFQTPLAPTRIIDLLQSVIPLNDQVIMSDTGVPFGDVLASAVQLQAPVAPDGSPLGFAPEHPAAKEIVLWEPLGLRVKPVVLAGEEFTMSVYLRPNMGLLALALQGQATDVRVNGWSGRFQTGNFFRTTCSDFFPDCKNLPDIATMHLPLLVDSVRLEAEGENITAAAVLIGRQIYASNSFLTPLNPMDQFDVDSGNGSFTLYDEESTVEFKAVGKGGTKKLSIVYRAKKTRDSLKEKLESIGEEYRAGTGKKKEIPSAPDSLGRI